jgi:hypothetical protein
VKLLKEGKGKPYRRRLEALGDRLANKDLYSFCELGV